MPLTSYAQNREDVLLARVFTGPTGFYLDIGAADPVELSVTKLFYERGWRGVNVEPQDDYFRKLVADRTRDINLQIVLSDRPGSVTLYIAPTHPGWATANEEVAAKMVAQGIKVFPRRVPALTLAQVCEEHVVGEIDFLKVDVEGEERNVLLGGDFDRWRPRVILVEATEQGGPTPNHDLWEDVLLGRGYLYATFDGLNRYYVRAEDEAWVETLRVPVNVFDDYVLYDYVLRIWEAEAHLTAQRQAAEGFAAEAAGLRIELTAAREQLAELTRSRDEVAAECERLKTVLANLTCSYNELQAREGDTRRRLDAARLRLQALRDALSRPGVSR
jgi:FkbM family methyltransferase